jgi:hypothetical protein
MKFMNVCVYVADNSFIKKVKNSKAIPVTGCGGL